MKLTVRHYLPDENGVYDFTPSGKDLLQIEEFDNIELIHYVDNTYCDNDRVLFVKTHISSFAIVLDHYDDFRIEQ